MLLLKTISGFYFLQVNNRNMISATHAEAVAALKSVTDKCSMMVSREVLVVLPEDVLPGSGECNIHVHNIMCSVQCMCFYSPCLQ